MLKRSGFKRKKPDPEYFDGVVLRSGYIGKFGGFSKWKPGKRSLLNARSKSDTSLTKEKIQATVREFVIIRDGGCILRNVAGVPPCNGYRKDGELILQADHLVTRANSGSFADVRLIVCVCQGHHGWKSVASNARKAEYDKVVRSILPKDRVALWDRVEADVSAHKTHKMDWNMQLVGVQLLLIELKEKHV